MNLQVDAYAGAAVNGIGLFAPAVDGVVGSVGLLATVLHSKKKKEEEVEEQMQDGGGKMEEMGKGKRKEPLADSVKSKKKRENKTDEEKEVILESDAQRQRVTRVPKAIKTKSK